MNKNGLIATLLKAGAIKFGDFTLRSGRKSPYFVNIGSVHSTPHLRTLSYYLAEAILKHESLTRIVFGPAYKGIPLAVATVQSLETVWWENTGDALNESGDPVGVSNVPSFSYLFNRKESKSHGDTGNFVGALERAQHDPIIIVDDVITDAGTKIEAYRSLISAFPNAEIVGVLVVFDRQEKFGGQKEGESAAEFFINQFGAPLISLLGVSDLITYLREPHFSDQYEDTIQSLANYMAKYGRSNA